MARKMPVGTIRHWENGDFIKAHDGSKFHNGWIPLSTSQALDDIGRICDSLANAMLYKKLPINGEKFLDHEIGEFEKEEGEEFGKYTPDDFKKYEGFAGASRYSFRNEFSRRWMEPKLKVAELVNEALIRANEQKGESMGKSYDQIGADDLLTTEEKAEIRATTRAQFKEERDEDQVTFSVKEAEELAAIVKRTKKQLDDGLNFEGKQAEAYDKCTAIANSLPVKYDRIAIKRSARDNAIAEIDEAFSDNWGVRESFRFYIDQQYGDYIKKFKTEIIRDEANDQESLFGVKLDEDPLTFYPKLYDKLQDNPKNYPFQELIGLRFETKYNKQLSGSWEPGMLPAIEQIESMLSTTPEGHFLTNYELKSVTQIDYNGGDHGGYAWYSPSVRQINLSKALMENSTGPWSRLSHGNEFVSTLAHEIGHAVSKKFGRDSNIKYKEFVVACGWSYQQEELRRGMTATGSGRDIPREGSTSHLELLTKYAHKSPEEAFAEYYSIYHNNRKEIDHWLSTNDASVLIKTKRQIAVERPSDRTVGQDLGSKFEHNIDNKHKIDRLLGNLHLDPLEHVNVELVSPWGSTPTEVERKNYSADKVKWTIGSSRTAEPMITVHDHGKYEILHGINAAVRARYEKKLTPSINISKEFHSALSSRGVSDQDISRYVVNLKSNHKVPVPSVPIKVLGGLDYRNNVIPVEQVRTSEHIFRKMRAIYQSEELKKALEEIAYF
jgi:hypothetical protein